MDAGRIIQFSYYADVQRKDSALFHMLRDGHAFTQLMEALHDRGYRYGDLIINSRHAGPGAYDSYSFTPDDLIVVTTRPPLSDLDERRKIPRTGTSLEERLLALMSQFVSRCTIDHVRLQSQVSDCFVKPEFKARSDLVFWTTSDARHTRSAYRVPANKGTPHTVAYLLYIESEAWPGGPGVLWSFAQGGPYTLVWNYWLRTRRELTGLVRDSGSRFVIADIEVDPPVTNAWTDLSPADTWAVDFEVVDLRLTGGAWVPVAKELKSERSH